MPANDYSTITLVGWYVKRKRNPTEKVPDTFFFDHNGITVELRGYEDGWFGGFAGYVGLLGWFGEVFQGGVEGVAQGVGILDFSGF